MKKNYIYITIFLLLLGCKAKDNYTGREYAPNMYHSVAYEPLTQIKDPEAGRWVTSHNGKYAEYFNSNPYNVSMMNMREPVEGTVKRNAKGFLPYRLPKDSLQYAGKFVKNPLDSSEIILSHGKQLFERFCKHCHGEKGLGDGEVGKVYKGVTPYNSAAVKNAPEGHIFHVITHGKGRMKSHSSQLSMEERWKIVRYVQTLQKQ